MTQPASPPPTLIERLEAWLQTVWYQGHQPVWLIRTALTAASSVFRVLRYITKQTEKAHEAKQACHPPVLVVGNLIAGGAGKTPIVQAVCLTLQSRGHRVGILTRGYKRKDTTPLLLKPGLPPDASACGDEPAWLLEQTGCPVAVGADRQAALQALLRYDPDLSLVVSDDGLQHHRLLRSLEWVVFDERLAGNGKLLPAGPLREPLSRLNTADAILCSALSPETLSQQFGDVSSGMNALPAIYQPKLQLSHFKNLVNAETITVAEALLAWQGLSIEAFTGLGNPDKFFRALKSEGFELAHCRHLPDHYDYPEHFCESLNGQIALTTGKDAVKLSPDPRVWVAQIEVTLPPELVQQIEAEIGRASH